MADTEEGARFEARPTERASLLLLAPPADGGATAYCRSHLDSGTTLETSPIVVLTDCEPAKRSSGLEDAGRPGVVIAVGDSTRSATTESHRPTAPTSNHEMVLATGDLGSIGRTVDDYVSGWFSSGHRPVVCVDSLAGLIDHESIEGVYRFLFVLLRRIEETDGVLHVHADPRVYEDEILRTFYSLFDRVVTFQDGSALL